jgi:hypothetical protein
MRVFASFEKKWKRLPARAVAPGLVAVLAAVGVLGHVQALIHVVGSTGWIWG